MPRRIENDCIAVISWAERACASGVHQTYRLIAEETGIPYSTLYEMVRWPSLHGEYAWVLKGVGEKYGYYVRFVGKPGEIIFVRKEDFTAR